MMTSPPHSVDEIRQHQLRALQSGLKTVRRTNAFYRDRLHDVTSWNDFERLPFTTKADLMTDQHEHPPYGTNLTFPLEEYVRLHQTSGTSGSQPLRWLDTAESWAWWERIWADLIYAPAGVMRDLQATVLCCTPTYALRLAEVAATEGIAVRLHRTIHAGEPGASIPSTRAAIESALGGQAFDHTGMTELGPTGVSCSQRDGVHLFESEFIFEIIDGELVATNLGRWGSPLIRYRTGDRVEVSRDPCLCGSPFMKIVGGIRGRVDDMVTIRGVNVYPSQVEDIVRRHPTVLEFVIECQTDRQMDEVTVLIERADGAVPDDVCRSIAEQLRATLGLRIECRPVPRGTLPRPELKAKRLIRGIVGT